MIARTRVAAALLVGVLVWAHPYPVSAKPQLVDVIVALTSQADLSAARAIPISRRAERLAAVARGLRTHADRTQKGVLELVRRRRGGGLVADVEPLWIANEVHLRAAPDVLAELAARPDVRAIRPNTVLTAPAPALAVGPAEPNVALVNAPALWDMGYRGQGIVVANLDTGVDATHPDLAARWRGGTNSWFDPSGQHPAAPTDVNGHGTMTMGLMTGGDAGGTAIGAAPDARWIAAKIFDDRGSSTAARIHRSFQWLLDPDGNPATADAPNVVSNSWNMASGSCNLEFQPDLRSLRAAGILPVFSAGNDGPVAGSVPSPANNPEAFAVGATDNDDALEPSSSRGPSPCGGSVAPAITAPGVNVRSSDTGGSYAVATGTSLAAPQAAGALALLLSAFGPLAADRQQAALQLSAHDLGPPGSDDDSGFGRLDVAAAYEWLRTAPDFGLSAAPSSQSVNAGATATVAITVGALNGFAADVGLSLTGLPSSVGTATFTPTVVRGAGSAHLTVATRADAPAGGYTLTIGGASGTLSRTATVQLTVPPRDFAVAVSPATVTITRGQSASYTIGVTPLGGFAGAVTLSLTGLPAGTTATFAPNPILPRTASALTVKTTAGTPRGTFTLTLSAVSGGVARTTTVTLTVR